MIILKGAVEIPMAAMAEALPALEEHVAATLEEPGNLAFEVTPNERSLRIMHFYEVFKDEAAYEAHQKLTKTRSWGKISQNFKRDFHREER